MNNEYNLQCDHYKNQIRYNEHCIYHIRQLHPGIKEKALSRWRPPDTRIEAAAWCPGVLDYIDVTVTDWQYIL